MSELAAEAQSNEITLSTRALVPTLHRIGNREIEATFLGNNTHGQPTWVLWNADEPYLIGVLRQGKMGFTFEQRTSAGVEIHEDVSFKRVRRALDRG
ncbi:hypothetical protein J4H92_07265 [Leucobacter weissii]|uniref:Uncharacterized protein n=1 Tax=Leucobacter weissii TaxID=1983706 RepID=A0A939S875_9MICO|nr:hypothetical protein [Leucobacter weissii]MBO1901751.1 hypothetical protein [Leucobacter weissii]